MEHLFLGLLLLGSVYTLGIGSTVKSAFLLAGAVSKSLTPAVFDALLFALTVIAGGISLLTGI